MYDSHGKKKRWSPSDLAICEYKGTMVRHSQAILPSYQSAYLCELDSEWDIDAQDYTSCYGRFANDNLSIVDYVRILFQERPNENCF